MRVTYKYVLVYGLTYGVLLGLDALILGGGHWAHIAMLLVGGELFRLYMNMINPGFDDRIAKNTGRRTASWRRNHIRIAKTPR